MIVFHDLDKLTGSNIHIIPLVLMWNIHWNIRGTQARADWGFYDVDQLRLDIEFVIEYFQDFFVLYLAFTVIHFSILAVFWRYIQKYDLYCSLRERFENQDNKFTIGNSTESSAVRFTFKFVCYHFAYFTVFTMLTLVLLFSKFL